MLFYSKIGHLQLKIFYPLSVFFTHEVDKQKQVCTVYQEVLLQKFNLDRYVHPQAKDDYAIDMSLIHQAHSNSFTSTAGPRIDCLQRY